MVDTRGVDEVMTFTSTLTMSRTWLSSPKRSPFFVLQATKSWGRPGDEARCEICESKMVKTSHHKNIQLVCVSS